MPTAFEFTDIAGIVKGASKGEGLGNKFLAHIREVDAICQVVRCFVDENITHVSGAVDPIDDIEVINLELALADLESVDKRLQRVSKMAKQKDKEAMIEEPVLLKIKEKLENGKPARAAELSDDELKVIKGLHLLTIKPMLYVANVSEDEVADADNNEYVKKYVSMLQLKVLKLLLFVQRLKKKFLSLMMKKSYVLRRIRNKRIWFRSTNSYFL